MSSIAYDSNGWRVGDVYNGQKITAVTPMSGTAANPTQWITFGNKTMVVASPPLPLAPLQPGKPAGGKAASGGSKPLSAESGRNAASARTLLVPSQVGLRGGGSRPLTLADVRTEVGRRTAELGGSMAGALSNTKRFMRLVACPDELSQVELNELPVNPCDCISSRLSNKSCAMGQISLRNNTLLALVPGQTAWCARIANSVGGAVAGNLLMLNMGSPNLMWTVAQAGLTTLTGTSSSPTFRLAPGYHMGYALSSDFAVPLPPVPVSYTDPSAAAVILFPVTDGTNYVFLIMSKPNQFVATMIGGVTLTSAQMTPSTTVPFTLSSFLQNGSGMTVTPIMPTMGGTARAVIMLDGPLIDNPGDPECRPNYTNAANVRLTSLAGALANKFGVEQYAVGAGSEGPYSNFTNYNTAVTYEGIAPSYSKIGNYARQHGIGELDPSNSKWYANNYCARIACKPHFQPNLLQDWTFVSGNTPPQTQNPFTVAPVQDPAAYAYDFNSNLTGWNHEMTVSFTLISNGGTTNSSAGFPFEYDAIAWVEALMNADSGFSVKPPQFDYRIATFGCVISSYPCMAQADSFKDYLKSVMRDLQASKTAEVARHHARKLWAVAKPILTDAGVQMLLSLMA